jgi:hypothetical protein
MAKCNNPGWISADSFFHGPSIDWAAIIGRCYCEVL